MGVILFSAALPLHISLQKSYDITSLNGFRKIGLKGQFLQAIRFLRAETDRPA